MQVSTDVRVPAYTDYLSVLSKREAVYRQYEKKSVH